MPVQLVTQALLSRISKNQTRLNHRFVHIIVYLQRKMHFTRRLSRAFFFINEQLSTVDDPIDIIIDELCNKTVVKLVWQGTIETLSIVRLFALSAYYRFRFTLIFTDSIFFLKQAINSLQELISQARGFKCSAHASHILGKCQ